MAALNRIPCLQNMLANTRSLLARSYCDLPRINKLADVQTAHLQKDNGAIYDKKPFKVQLEKGKSS